VQDKPAPQAGRIRRGAVRPPHRLAQRGVRRMPPPGCTVGSPRKSPPEHIGDCMRSRRSPTNRRNQSDRQESTQTDPLPDLARRPRLRPKAGRTRTNSGWRRGLPRTLPTRLPCQTNQLLVSSWSPSSTQTSPMETVNPRRHPVPSTKTGPVILLSSIRTGVVCRRRCPCQPKTQSFTSRPLLLC